MRRVKLEARVNTPKIRSALQQERGGHLQPPRGDEEEGVREIVFASSSSLYGEPEEIPVGEDTLARLVSVYGARLKVKRRHGGRLRILSSVYSEPDAHYD
jgi:hypothetical protein